MKAYLVYNAQSEVEAALTKSFLENQGIQAYVGGATVPIGWMFDESSAARLPKGVYVLGENVHKAKKILKNRYPNRVRAHTLRKADRTFALVMVVVLVALLLVIIFRS